MDSIEKLRKQLAMSMDTWFKRELVRIADEIEAELAERYMKLPVDADGVPIRPGDKLIDMDGLVFEVEMLSQDDMRVFKDGSYDEVDNFEFFKHYKPRTIEDVLRDVVALCANTWKDKRSPFGFLDPEDVMDSGNIAKYADELRGMMGAE